MIEWKKLVIEGADSPAGVGGIGAAVTAPGTGAALVPAAVAAMGVFVGIEGYTPVAVAAGYTGIEVGVEVGVEVEVEVELAAVAGTPPELVVDTAAVHYTP